MDLPLEIQVMVYEAHLVNHRGYIPFFHKIHPLRGWVQRPALGINLLLVCKAVHDVAINVLYGKNNFCILPQFDAEVAEECGDGYPEVLLGIPMSHQILKIMGPVNRARIRQVCYFVWKSFYRSWLTQ